MKRSIILISCLFIGALLFQGFQCSSPEMTTAKMAYQNKDYDKAEENIKKELKKNPKNEEAHLLLAEIYMMTNRIKDAAGILNESDSFLKTQKYKVNAATLENKILVGSYNQAYSSYSKYFESKNKEDLDKAIEASEIALMLRPQYYDLYNLKGRIYETLENKDQALASYNEFAEIIQPELDFAKEQGIYINQTRDEALNKLGKVEKSKVDTLQNGSVNYTDVFKLNDKKAYLFSSLNTESGNVNVLGWRSNYPTKWTENEQMIFSNITSDPFAALTQIYYERKDLDNAIKNINKLLILEPNNKEANSFKIQIYQESGKADDAENELKELTKKNPENKRYWLQYGDLLSNLSKFKEAIEKYEKALEIDPDFDYALFNIASSHKNLAGIYQLEEKEKQDSDANYEVKFDRYFPDLEKSAEYFERALKTETFSNKPQVLIQLANIYQVMEKDSQLKSTLTKMEAVINTVPSDEKKSYYLELLKIYSTMGNDAKTQEISRILESL